MPPLQETVNRKNRDEGWHTHTAGICVFLSHSALPRYYRHRAQRHRQNTSVCTGISFTCQPKCSSDCQLQNTGQPTDTYKHTPRHAHTNTHTLTHDCIPAVIWKPKSVLAHFSSLFQTQQQPKLPLSKSSLKAKQLYGPERCLRADESECHTSIRTAYTLDLGILSYWYPDVGRSLRGFASRRRVTAKHGTEGDNLTEPRLPFIFSTIPFLPKTTTKPPAR